MNNRRLSIAGIVCGALLALGPVWGIALTVLSMFHAFQTLGQAGVSDPRHLAQILGNSLMATTIGLVLCPVGLVVLAVSICFLTRKSVPTPPPLPQEENSHRV
jgi:biopolymer transport protein ExbB/TolQ